MYIHVHEKMRRLEVRIKFSYLSRLVPTKGTTKHFGSWKREEN